MSRGLTVLLYVTHTHSTVVTSTHRGDSSPGRVRLLSGSARLTSSSRMLGCWKLLASRWTGPRGATRRLGVGSVGGYICPSDSECQSGPLHQQLVGAIPARRGQASTRTGRKCNCSLDAECRYDTIWAQWVLLYLTDDDLVSFFERCKKGLTRREGREEGEQNSSCSRAGGDEKD